MNNHIDENADLIVIGGGIAGCVAAISAARLGIKVILVQNRPVLGGNASSEIGLLMAGADRDFHHVRESGIIEEIELANRFHNHEVQWRNCISDAVLEFMVKEAGVALYLNTHVHDLEIDGRNAIRTVIASQQSTERSYRFSAPLFVDATGDGSVAAMAGAEYRTGSEGRDEFGESRAPEKPSNVTMGSTLMFRVKDMGKPVPFVRPPWAYEFPSTDSLPVKIHKLDYPQLWIEYGARLDTIKDNMEIREELLKILYGVWDHIKNHGSYGAENLVLSWAGSVPGKRESRRVMGDYILKQSDLTDPQEHHDAVAYGGWPVDIHNPDGFYAKHKWLDYLHLGKPYPIPYRCYYSKNISNLFMAGRNISATHVAHGSIRLIRTCGVGGQAVGTAAFLCTKHGKSPRDFGKDHIPELQQLLLKYDCHIPGIMNNDLKDLARKATIRASSEYEDPESKYIFSADKVKEGLSRGRPDDENLWMSAPLDSDQTPHIILDWETPVNVNTIHLTFDTMIREKRFFDRPVLGPIPTCVKDFIVEYRETDDAEWIVLKEIKGNYLRHRIIKFSTVNAKLFRIRIISTNGDDKARIYEIRAYNG